MRELVKQLVDKIDALRTMTDNSQGTKKIWLRLVLIIIYPCRYILNLKINDIVKFIISIVVLLIMIFVALIIIPYYALWFLWKKSNYNQNTKIIITVAIVFLLLISYSSLSNKMLKHNPVSSADISNTQPTDVENEKTSTAPSEVTISITEKTTTTNKYVLLTKNKKSYILLLKVLGNSYIDYHISDSLYKEMHKDKTVEKLVKKVLDYKYKNKAILPDFNESFSLFWNDELEFKYPKVRSALQKSFNVCFDSSTGKWDLEAKPENNTITETIIKTTSKTWLPAIGHLYNGVKLYIVTDDTTTLYGIVTSYDTKLHQVQVYLKEADDYMWFSTRETNLLSTLKVRSNDSHLPD